MIKSLLPIQIGWERVLEKSLKKGVVAPQHLL